MGTLFPVTAVDTFLLSFLCLRVPFVIDLIYCLRSSRCAKASISDSVCSRHQTRGSSSYSNRIDLRNATCFKSNDFLGLKGDWIPSRQSRASISGYARHYFRKQPGSNEDSTSDRFELDPEQHPIRLCSRGSAYYRMSHGFKALSQWQFLLRTRVH